MDTNKETENTSTGPALTAADCSRCECGEDSTGWVEVKCCNICGRPHAEETLDWHFDRMKDHEISQLVNLIRDEIERICSNQSLRFRISQVVTNYFHAKGRDSGVAGRKCRYCEKPAVESATLGDWCFDLCSAHAGLESGAAKRAERSGNTEDSNPVRNGD